MAQGKTSIRHRIHRTDPYADFSIEGRSPDTQGWGSQHPVFNAVLRRIRPTIIVEVGTWKGASAIHMADLCKRLGLACEIICVDTWLGSPGIYTRPDDQYYASLAHIHGYPSLYYTFLTNVVSAGHADIITPLALPTQLAAEVLHEFGLQADVIYIDAAHDYRSVSADLESFWPLLNPNGVLIGDDYLVWPGVTRAANEFAGRIGHPLFTAPGKFVLARKADFMLDVTLS